MRSNESSMLEGERTLFERIHRVHFACCALIRQKIGYNLPVAGNIAIFCQYDAEYELFATLREILIEPSDNPNQKYCLLKEPITIPERNGLPAQVYTHLYVRKPDPTLYGQFEGDVDFVLESEEYEKLKSSVSAGNIDGMKIYERPNWDAIQIADPNVSSVAYVGTKEFFEKVRSGKV